MALVSVFQYFGVKSMVASGLSLPACEQAHFNICVIRASNLAAELTELWFASLADQKVEAFAWLRNSTSEPARRVFRWLIK